MDSRVEEIHPDSHLRTFRGVRRQQSGSGVSLFEIFIDDGRFVNHAITFEEHWNFSVRIEVEQVFGLVLQVDLGELIGDVLLGQDNPCPVGVRSGVG